MLTRPVKWRRVGIAALAGISLTLTALAAQVSPPNIRTVDAVAKPEGGAKHGERVAIKLPTATLDRYVGAYKLNDQIILTVTRDGEKLMARLTGQPTIEIYPESETRFFWKVVDAQLEFTVDGSSNAQSATLYQYGQVMPMPRVDASEATAAQSALDARIQSQAQSPGTEAALRREIEAEASGRILYEEMEPMLEQAARAQEANLLTQAKMRGKLLSLTFKGVGNQGWDNYEAQFENAKVGYAIAMAPNGKIAGLLGFAAP